MTYKNYDATSASHPRAQRLQQEAQNCLEIAVREKDGGFAADLIDEAVRLANRARELSEQRAA